MARRLVLLLTAVASAGYVARVAITVAAPGMMSELHLTAAQMGGLFSAFLFGYTLFQLPSGALADRVNARWIFAAICGAWTLLTALPAAIGPRSTPAVLFGELWAVRALFGVAAAPTYPTSGRTIAAAIAPSQQARANSLVLSSVGIGSAVTPLMLAPVASHFGWRAALGCAAMLCAIVGALWWRLAPNVTASPQARPDQRLVATSLRTSSFACLCASYFLQAYLGYIFIFWFFLYLLQVRHFEVLNAAAFAALPWIATIVAIPAGGVLSDAAVRRWGATWGRRSIPASALCGAAVFLVVGARTPSAFVAVVSLTVCTVLVLSTEGPFWATMTAHAGGRSGIGGGTMNFAGNLGGLISPTLTPWLAERVGWETALTVTAALAIVSGALWLGVVVAETPTHREA